MDKTCWIIHQEKYESSEIAVKIRDFIDLKDVKKVFIKPNFVIDPWKGEEANWVATVTNIKLIEAVLGVLREKSQNHPIEITIGDAPMARTNIKTVLKLNGLINVIRSYETATMKIKFIDIREWYWKYVAGMCVSRTRLKGDPQGNVLVNLGKDSAFFGKKSLNFEAFDNIVPVSEFHNDRDNTYSISRSVIDSDLFINLPKMKTHRIAGMTCAMKNLVGINSNKNCVPHNTVGNAENGGDESPEDPSIALNESVGIGGFARRIFRMKIPAINYVFVPIKIVYDKLKKHGGVEKIGYGMWYGNDTIWRSILDLNRIILFADNRGGVHEEQQRKYLCITDAIISGEGEGPLHPSPVDTQLLLIAHNPLVIDSVACELMGLDYNAIPTIVSGFKQMTKFNISDFLRDEIVVYDNEKQYSLNDLRKHYSFYFRPTAGWKGHIELKE